MENVRAQIDPVRIHLNPSSFLKNLKVRSTACLISNRPDCFSSLWLMSYIIIQACLEGTRIHLFLLQTQEFHSHVAYVMRRFRRVCSAVGSEYDVHHTLTRGDVPIRSQGTIRVVQCYHIQASQAYAGHLRTGSQPY